MNNKWQAHTSEKLFLADVQLKQWEDQLDAHTGRLSKPIEESFKQASMLLISLGWESLLNEIAEYHQQKTDYIDSFQQLKTLLGEEIPEVVYLSQLALTQDSWLYDISHFNNCLKQPQPRASSYASSLSKDALIAVSSNSEAVNSLKNLTHVLGEFKEYLNSLRSRMSEW